MLRTLQAAALPRIEARQLPAAATLAALGIVYGDIGTSPLYGFKQAADAGGTISPETIMGIVSVILWSLIVIVSFKYAILIMRADNRGEGGIVALLGAARCPACAGRELARLPADRRADRRRTALRRRRHHAGDFGAECRRRSQARRTPARAGHRSDQHRDPGRPVPGPAQGNRVHRQHLRAGHADLVHRDRPARPARHHCGHPAF